MFNENPKSKPARRQFLSFMGTSASGLLLYGCGGGGGVSETLASLADDEGASTGESDSLQALTNAAATENSPAELSAIETKALSGSSVIVIGGGMAGATVAKYLRLWSGNTIAVTLIERDSAYTSNILSNLVLTGKRSLSSLQYRYDTLRSKYGVHIITDEVISMDPVTKTVRTLGNRTLKASRIVVAPGIDFDLYNGLTVAQASSMAPHAWKAGPQTNLLAAQIKAMPAGGTFVMTIPAAPYRCPPGPYERACVVADWLKKNKKGSKVVVLDANAAITAEKENFTHAFNVIHKGVIEYIPNAPVASIDPSTKKVSTPMGDITATVLNAIPPQRASSIASATGLNNVNGRWCGVDVLSYESTAAPGIHVLGDASATTQPKAGHIANQEAKVCADAIVRLLSGQAVDPAPVTNSACYTPITATTASWLTVVYAYDPVSKTMKPVGGAPTEASSISKDNYSEMLKWFNTLMGETFA